VNDREITQALPVESTTHQSNRAMLSLGNTFKASRQIHGAFVHYPQAIA